MIGNRKGVVVSASASGAGKTTVTLGLLAALKARGLDVGSAKTGPDYIDPAFHAAATGHPCITLDAWCAEAAQLRARMAEAAGSLVVVEGAMGLFDAALSAQSPLGRGSTADVALALDLPVIVVIDAARRAQSAAAIVHGLASFREGVRIAGAILNRIASPRHETMIRRAVETVMPVFGAIPRDGDLAVPSRHLGLQQAREIDDLAALLASLGGTVTAHCDLEAVIAAAAPLGTASQPPRRLPPLGQRIAVARDDAFGFTYPHMVADWRAGGAEIEYFSPLADEGPSRDCDAVFLPGGYPELFAGKIASAEIFRRRMEARRDAGALIYGECGGYMVLGAGLVDAFSRRHRMLGFLDLETSFAERRLSLGYRTLAPLGTLPWPGPLKGHEFHYSAATREVGTPLFEAVPSGEPIPSRIGLREGRVAGSYAHVVERG